MSDMSLQPGITKLEFTMGAHGLVWTSGTTTVERVSCQARLLGVRPGWSISMVNGTPITDSATCWHELQKCKKSGQRYHVYFLKDEASIRQDLAKAEAERQRATKAAEERRLHEEAERLRTEQATAAAERQKQSRTRLEALSKDLETEKREIDEARALAERKAAEARERAQRSPEFALEELGRLRALVAANEAREASVLAAIDKMSGVGLIAKSRAAEVSAGVQQQQHVASFMALVEELYTQKRGTILDELLDNLKGTGPAGDPAPLEIRLLAEVCRGVHDKYSARPLNEGLQAELLAICTWVVYTMQDVDIDRLLCCKDVPELPEGMEEPALRDEFYSEYRQRVRGTRNPQMFQVANWAARVCFDSAGDRKDALDGLRTWIRWVCFLGLSAKTLEKPVAVTRGLCGLPGSLVDGFRSKAPGDQIFWAAPSSTTDDASISETYCNQQAPKENNVLFTISGVTHAFPMMELSAYPKEREWLLPPFTTLVVERVVDGAPLQLHCKFGGCVLTAAFREQVSSDFVAASRRLSMWYAESRREQEALRKELDAAEERAKEAGADMLKAQLSSARKREQESREREEKMSTEMKPILDEVSRMKSEADRAMQEAMPAMEAASESANSLNKNGVSEMGRLAKPPVECADVMAAVAFLLNGTDKKIDWKGAQKLLQNAPVFIDQIVNFDAKEIPEQALKKVDELTALPFFNYDTLMKKSVAAAQLANWVINTVKFHKIYVKVSPLMQLLKEATARKEEAEAQVKAISAERTDLLSEIDRLETELGRSA